MSRNLYKSIQALEERIETLEKDNYLLQDEVWNLEAQLHSLTRDKYRH